MAPTTKTSKPQPSRKGKKAWRKNVDIATVETGLEQVREEVTAGGVIKEKADTALFALDLGGSEQIHKREQKHLKPLRADEILAARSAIEPVSFRKRAGNPNLTNGLIEPKRKRRDGISHAHLQRLRATANQHSSTATLPKTAATELYDAWDAPPPPAKEDRPEFSFLEKKEKVKPPKTMRHAPVALTVAVDNVPAVRLPEGGISYNPDYAQWDELLQAEGAKEVARERARIAQKEEEDRLAVLVATGEEDFQPDAEDAEDDEDESDGSESEVEGGEDGERPKVEVKRKTQTQRNKEARLKAEALEAAARRHAKLQARELHLIRKYAKDAKAQEKLRMARLIAKKVRPADDARNPKLMRKRRFGKANMPEAPLELQLTDELTESLRRLKPEGNLLSDRFRSLRERGLVETRTPVIYGKKYKRTQTEKWSYKDFK
ncbi:ribosome biogenesis protein Nop53/GLTSCR2 [Geopyxis carbonaria]|nr:ribosome biogenesis protein Nop53/GLTSCR2 [Geopyxis carbonaria]